MSSSMNVSSVTADSCFFLLKNIICFLSCLSKIFEDKFIVLLHVSWMLCLICHEHIWLVIIHIWIRIGIFQRLHSNCILNSLKTNHYIPYKIKQNFQFFFKILNILAQSNDGYYKKIKIPHSRQQSDTTKLTSKPYWQIQYDSIKQKKNFSYLFFDVYMRAKDSNIFKDSSGGINDKTKPTFTCSKSTMETLK